VYNAVHEDSFVDFRKVGNYKGPEAIFSRYNLSINMTRSIGDKYAARCVVPIPDISVVTIRPNEFARFVICSDGVWDVMDMADLLRMAFAARAAEEMSMRIALEAQARRVSRRVRMDDISVIVVDVNLHHYGASSTHMVGCGVSSCVAS
jgi:serine/threonine protein phosphatase PrpC